MKFAAVINRPYDLLPPLVTLAVLSTLFLGIIALRPWLAGFKEYSAAGHWDVLIYGEPHSLTILDDAGVIDSGMDFKKIRGERAGRVLEFVYDDGPALRRFTGRVEDDGSLVGTREDGALWVAKKK